MIQTIGILLVFGLMTASAQEGIKDDLKTAGKATGDAAKKTGQAVVGGTSKAAGTTVDAVKKGAEKTGSAVKRVIRGPEDQWFIDAELRKLADINAGRAISPELIDSNFLGVGYGKGGSVELIRSADLKPQASPSAPLQAQSFQVVRPISEVAVVTYELKAAGMTYQVSSVWVSKSGSWKTVLTQETLKTPPAN